MSTAVAVRTPKMEIQEGLEARKIDFRKMLPAHVSWERFEKSVMVACTKNPALFSVERKSLFQAITAACQLGLDVSGVLGSAYIVPFKGQAQLIPGYRGLLELARRSGEIVSIAAHVVRDGDEFEYELGLDPKLRHVPNLEREELGGLRLVYAVAKLKDGGVQVEVMSKAQIEAVRRKSPSGNSGPWKDHYDEMARKTVVRRLIKWLPISTEQLTRAAQLDAASDGEEVLDVTYENEDFEPAPSGRAAEIAARLEDRQPGDEG